VCNAIFTEKKLAKMHLKLRYAIKPPFCAIKKTAIIAIFAN